MKLRTVNGINKLKYKNSTINSNILINHINNNIISRITNKNPSTDKNLYSYRDPYGTNGIGVFTRNPSCWLNGVNNISCISPAQMSGATWYQRGATLISPRHIALAKHFTTAILPGGTDIKFVDENNNVIIRKLKSYAYSSLTDIAIGLLDSDVPNTIKFAKILPLNHASYIPNQNKYVVTLDQEQKASVAANAILWSYPSLNLVSAYTPNTSDTLPYSFWEIAITGDSGQPIFLIIDNDLVIVSTFWGANNGPPYTTLQNHINTLMNSLGGGYNLTPVNLEAVYNKYK